MVGHGQLCQPHVTARSDNQTKETENKMNNLLLFQAK